MLTTRQWVSRFVARNTPKNKPGMEAYANWKAYQEQITDVIVDILIENRPAPATLKDVLADTLREDNWALDEAKVLLEMEDEAQERRRRLLGKVALYKKPYYLLGLWNGYRNQKEIVSQAFQASHEQRMLIAKARAAYVYAKKEGHVV